MKIEKDKQYDFSGWATKNNILCSDGRVIRQDAFKHYDQKKIPLVWNHKHNAPENILGHAILENRPEGVYAYCSFNDTESGMRAKKIVKHGDLEALSIYADGLRQKNGNVLHGEIRELSLVLAGANKGATIDNVLMHSDGSLETLDVDEGIFFTGDSYNLTFYHSDISDETSDETVIHSNTKKETDTDEKQEKKAEQKTDKAKASEEKSDKKDDETAEEIFDTLNEKQKSVVYALVDQLVSDAESDDKNEDKSDTEKTKEGGSKTMKHNVFDNAEDVTNDKNVLCHSDEVAILELAKKNGVGSLKEAMHIYLEENDKLAHGIDGIEQLFPDYKDVRPGAPELLTNDLGWVSVVMNKVHKNPLSRIRTRQTDARGVQKNAKGYKKGSQKKDPVNAKLLKRTTDPQTVYRRDAIHRDDVIDITDFDYVEYQYIMMKNDLYEELAIAMMIGDGREDADEDKISEEHIRSIWNDDELYSIHADVDIEAAKKELQGTNTSASFSENYIYAEAIITAALYSREDYKGSGSLDFYCTPHLLNVMLLARDMNGRRIYDSKDDLARALNVANIYTAEQFEGRVRTDKESKKHKLLGIFVNLADYDAGSTKGGEITKFEQFDIDFNKNKYLIETRMSGALTKVYSAVVLEEPVAATSSPVNNAG